MIQRHLEPPLRARMHEADVKPVGRLQYKDKMKCIEELESKARDCP